MVGMADALALAEQGGLDVSRMLEMVGSGMGGSRALTGLGPKALEGDYKPGFLVEHFRKDLGLAIEQSEDLDITLPGVETAFTLYDMLDQIGGGRLGTQALTLLYAEQADAVTAGLDWGKLDTSAFESDDHDHECSYGHDHGHGHECTCGHDHDDGHECACGHGDDCHCEE